MNVTDEKNKLLLAQTEKFQRLQRSMNSLVQAGLIVTEAVELDEVTDLLVNTAAGLASSEIAKLGAKPEFDQPLTANKSIVAQTLVSNIIGSYDTLNGIRNRALCRMMNVYQKRIIDHLAFLQHYAKHVFPAVVKAKSYGTTKGIISGTQVVDDKTAQYVAYAGYQDEHTTFPTAVGSILEHCIQHINNIHRPIFNEWIEASQHRFNQGDGFSPVKKEFTGSDGEVRLLTYCCTKVYVKMGIGTVDIDYCGDASYKFEPLVGIPTAQETSYIIQCFNVFIEKLMTCANNSPIIMRDYTELHRAIVDNPMTAESFSRYFNEDDGHDDTLPFAVNKVADLCYGQLQAFYHCIDKVVFALPIIMNYCIKDKL